MTEIAPPCRLVKTQVIADLVGVTTQTLRTWAKNPHSTFPRPVWIAGKTVRYDLAEVEAWLADRRARLWVDKMLAAGETAASAAASRK
jgi:predicted DNA-binding transcriptional regulator AlpA